MEEVLKDDRFAHVAKDPRFRKVPLKERKVKIDNRFKHMFKDKRFKMKYTVDKRGRPVNLTTNENLKKYYELSDEDSSDANEDVDEDEEDGNVNDARDEVPKPKEKIKAKRKPKEGKLKVKHKKLVKGKQNDEDSSDANDDVDKDDDDEDNGDNASDEISKPIQKGKSKGKQKKVEDLVKGKQVPDAVTKKKQDIEDEDDSDEESEEESEEDFPTNDSGVDLARGVGNAYSSSSSDDDSSEDDDDDDDFDHGWGERDENVVAMEEATCRLAVCNMDWDRMKARDIYMLLNSFKPTKGLIKSVKVYPSEFGKERMAEEEKQGPKELTEIKIEGDFEEEDDEGRTEDDEGTSYHMEKLREYQLKRLRYYYAVVECDTAATADTIYKECDGLEYESSCTRLDLRFIPDDMDFEETDVTSSCTEAPANYKPIFFNNAALSQSKVDLTWDETDRERVQLTAEQFSKSGDDIEEENLKAYLASSSDEEAPDYSTAAAEDDDEVGGSGDEDRQINKYKALLLDMDRQQEKGKGDVQMEITWEPGLKETTETILKKKKKHKDSTVWEEYLEKRKEKKMKKLEERKNKKKMWEQDDQFMDDNDDNSEEDTGPQEGELAFSDDEVPGGVDSFMMAGEDLGKKNNKKKDKKNKMGKKHKESPDPDDPQKIAELSLLMMGGGEEEGKKHFNFNDLVEEEGQKKKKKKMKKREEMKGIGKESEEDFQVNVTDPRFSAVYDSHLFNIDPSAPEFRKTKGTELMISEKLKRNRDPKKNKRAKSDNNLDKSSSIIKKVKLDESDKLAMKDDSLANLVKSVKAKTKHFQTNKVKR
ncbi:ESF1 homolog isoform X2 [Dreissena polymorpha]|uniref:ESF1 homolog isoform X2 n=1 Tax=Dreissena polymorpha TaxID=45954 RepID=UPI002264A179|nr:ESF1 homolog isoform X2 [Dreissena polymorpha]